MVLLLTDCAGLPQLPQRPAASTVLVAAAEVREMSNTGLR